MKWASTSVHPKTFKLIPDGRQRRRQCWLCNDQGKRNYATHVGLCNGLAMCSGCEWHMRAWAKGKP